MVGSVKRHRDAAARHEAAAATHEHSAQFWVAQGDDARAALHRDAAVHEREGAALERRWAELIESEEQRPGRNLVEGATGRLGRTAADDRGAGADAREIE